MKKVLLNLALALGVISANAQTPVGTVVNDFSLTDINGTTHTLFEYLDAGKMVVIDVSATWCGPCWNYHNTNALELFYEAHGPAGANDAMVFFVEGDPSTTSADLNGTGGNTQGNWVAGATHPIIDLVTTASFENSGLTIDYFPEMYIICPNRVVFKGDVAGAIGTLELLNSYIGQCPSVAVDPSVTAYTGQTNSCDGNFNMSVTLQNNGLDALTSCSFVVAGLDGPLTYDWTGNLGSLQTTTVNLGTGVSAATGTATIAITSADPTPGTVDANLNVIDPSNTTAIPYTTDFTAAGFPYANWRNENPDGSIGWEIYGSATAQGNVAFIYTFVYETPIGAMDYLITAPFNLSNASNPGLNFKVANRRYSATYYDKLSVEVATNCDGPWTQVWSKEGTALATGADYTSGAWEPTAASDWRTEGVSLANYANTPSLFVRFASENHYGNNVFIDDINVTDNFVGVENVEIVNANLNAYPNPTNSNTNVNFALASASDVQMNIINMLGENVYSNDFGTLAAGNYNEVVNFNNMPNGLYLVNLNVNGKVSTLRLTVSK
jgi:hypothetical protein